MAQRSSQRAGPPTQPPRGHAPSVPATQVVRRFTTPLATTRGQRLRAWATRLALPSAPPPRAHGYVAAVAGVAVASLFIAVVQTQVHVRNISLAYLLVVLWLAATFGRGPAILASILSFLSYDFFFIPPLYRLTVNDPTEWLSLFALLATALVLGQLTATVQARARDARESQQRTETLYALDQLIVSATDQQPLLEAVARRVYEVFASDGVAACALILADADGAPSIRASVPGDGPAVNALSLQIRERAAQADWALHHGTAVGLNPASSSERPAGGYAVLYVPLMSSGHIVGVLGISGLPAIHQLASEATAQRAHPPTGAAGGTRDPRSALFAAFCDQIALALDRATLQQQAIHAEALRESDHLKDVLLGSVTHDLRTPLASIQAAASSLLSDGIVWSETDRRELLESIDMSAKRLNRLVSNLLDLSRLEAGVAVPEKDWHLIGEVIGTVLERLELAGQTRGRQMLVDVPDDGPLVPMDHGQIEEVLTNLIENAIKYSPAESPVRIQARVVGMPAELEVRVVDQGIGIPTDELNAIFGKFYRVQHVRLPWANRPPVGTGLGLAISDGIIRAHGGRIWAESTPGQGSTFVFTLPIPEDSPKGALPELAVSAPKAAATSTGASE